MVERIKNGTRNVIRKVSSFSYIFWLLIFLGIILFLLTTTYTAYLKNKQLQRYAWQLSEEIDQIQQRNKDIGEEIIALYNDPVYLEMVIRRNLRMLKEDEIPITQDNHQTP